MMLVVLVMFLLYTIKKATHNDFKHFQHATYNSYVF